MLFIIDKLILDVILRSLKCALSKSWKLKIVYNVICFTLGSI